jgi:hypothetical protein
VLIKKRGKVRDMQGDVIKTQHAVVAPNVFALVARCAVSPTATARLVSISLIMLTYDIIIMHANFYCIPIMSLADFYQQSSVLKKILVFVNEGL